MFCKQCGKEHDGSYGSGIFCSPHCARQYSALVNKEVKNKKISESLKGRKHIKTEEENIKEKLKYEEYEQNPNYCSICGKILEFNKRFDKTCGSKECVYHNCGGVRKNSGNSLGGWYKGIFCHSTYELVFVIYCLDHNINIKRCETTFKYFGTDNKEHTYYPDFIVNNEIIEIKGYFSDSVKLKEEAVLKAGKSYKILYKKDLTECFNYVYNNYTNNLKTLYEDYKPKYKYVCSHCGKEFYADNKRTTEKVYCCRKCSLLGNHSVNSNKISEGLKRYYAEHKTDRKPYKRKYKQQWITNGTIKTRIPLGNEIPEGFHRGRK